MTSRIIKVLPKDLADKIAAGEVVERPLSIVKELIENSIDAGADSITVEIGKGGKELIRVSDNGCGMEKDQLGLAFKRYATSKISTEEDLNAIETLGFRGEALASIASVSHVEMITKARGQRLGAKISLDAGEIVKIEDSACEEGTTIVVRDLFFNTPARRKFLKPDNTEASLITDYVSKMSIAYPGVRIRMISNSSILFSTPGKGDLYSAILTVYSAQIARNLIPVAAEDSAGGLRISGYISKPTESRSNRKWQIFFVNGRLVKSKVLEDAVSEAYHDKMFEGHYPLVFLFLETDPSKVDVNIHPHKTEIRFFNENDIFEFSARAVRASLLNPEALSAYGKPAKTSVQMVQERKSVPPAVKPETKASEEKKLSVAPVKTAPVKTAEKAVFAELPSKAPEKVKAEDAPAFTAPEIFPAEVLSEEKEPFTEPENQEKSFEDLRYRIEQKTTAVQETMVIPQFKAVDAEREFRFSELTYFSQFDNSYLVCSKGTDLFLIDQHAAHERVMYEKFRNSFDGEALAAQALITPIVIDLTRAQKLMFDDVMQILSGMGFAAEDFGADSVIVKEIPECLTMDQAEEFFKASFVYAEEGGGKVRLKNDELATRACKSAVKANDVLTAEEVKRLFADLDKCENPFSCPHGRPTFIKFSVGDIERMFKRK